MSRAPRPPPPPPAGQPATLIWTGTRYRWVSPSAAGLILTSQHPDPMRWLAPATQTSDLGDTLAASRAAGLANRLRFREHFLGVPVSGITTLTYGPWLVSTSGAGATVSGLATSETDRPGVIRLTQGTTAAGRSAIHGVRDGVRLGGGEWQVGWVARPTTLSNGTQRYQLAVGLIDNPAAVDQADGIYFVYDEGGVSAGSAASANWQCVTSKGSARTWTTSSVAVSATNWVELEARVNAAGTSVDFVIDGVTVATHTTNIPTGTGETCEIGAATWKSIGTTAREIDLDYAEVLADLT